ncbi:MAG: hypothetical protein ABEJ77_06700 [Halanaeroarchaeum sp.]
MVTLQQRVPDRLQLPASFASLFLGIAGITLGYVFTLTGIVLYFDLHPVAQHISVVESVTVFVVGLVVFAVGVVGWRGFMYFAT